MAAENLHFIISKSDNKGEKSPIKICDLPFGWPPLSVECAASRVYTTYAGCQPSTETTVSFSNKRRIYCVTLMLFGVFL